MRPIKLTMTAFGPYSKTEVVDFEKLENKNLFLITGPTGAGKTTIFDAISFAMYGEANGNMRNVESLRSHFAKDDTLTEVELTFRLKGVEYKIHRIPAQKKRRIRGEGFTEQKAEATLIIKEQLKPITGKKEVDEKIEEIVGINAEQFRQIMMIPQGEFKKLLVADSKDREKVLQKLFDTSLYSKFQMELDTQSKKMYGEIKEKGQRRDQELSNIECEQHEQLQELIEKENKQIKRIIELTKEMVKKDNENITYLDSEITKFTKRIENSIREKEKAINSNNDIEQKEIIRKSINEKEKQKEEIDSKKNKIKKAETALVIKPIEDNYKSKVEELAKKVAYSEIIIKDTKLIEQNKTEKETAFNKALSSEQIALMNKLNKELVELKLHELKVKEIEIIIGEIETAKDKCLNIKQSKINNKILLESLEIELKGKKENKEQAISANLQIALVKEQYDKTSRILEYIEKLINSNKQLEENNINYTDNRKNIESNEDILAKMRETYNKNRYEFHINQAAILALDLKQGDKCPVCGSKNHIELAKLTKNAITKEQLDKEENVLKEKEISNQNKLMELAIEKEQIDKLKKDIVEITINLEKIIIKKVIDDNLEKECNEYKIQLVKIEEKKEKLEKVSNELDDINLEILVLDKKIKEEAKNKDELQNQYNMEEKILIEIKSNLKNIYKDVPEHLRTIQQLHDEIRKKENIINKAKLKQEKTRSELDVIKKEYTEVITKKILIDKYIKENTNELIQTKSKLDNKIEQSEFIDFKHYIDSKLSKEQIDEYKVEVKTFEDQLHFLKQQHKELSLKTKDLVITNISEIEDNINKLKQDEKLIRDDFTNVNRKVNTNMKILTSVNQFNVIIEKQENIYSIIGDLSKIANGTNTARITFERYVLAAFLEDILKAANLRLKKMTEGRYELFRTENLERKNKQSGLELEVYDSYTGKKRHVKTLSGGESFKASLAMALGLSDVVQAYSGGVSLDTMFIDEGFGTLDQSSLDSAINCLIELQESGRLVGIISHVQELKERIDTRLEVTSTTIGSQTRFVV